MVRNRKCPWCHKWFSPHPRLRDRQKSCGRKICKQKQKRLSQKNWQRQNRIRFLKGLSDWGKAHRHYWKKYREEHPAYEKRNRFQSKIRWAQSKHTLQKRIDILQVTDKSVKYWNLPLFAKETRSLTPLLWAYDLPP